MEQPRERDSRLSKSHRWSRDEQRVDGEHFAITRGADDLPARIVSDLVRPNGTGKDKVRVALRDILERDRLRRLRYIRVHVARPRDVHELIHEASAADRDQRRIPDMPENVRARELGRGG